MTRLDQYYDYLEDCGAPTVKTLSERIHRTRSERRLACQVVILNQIDEDRPGDRKKDENAQNREPDLLGGRHLVENHDIPPS